MPKVLLKISVRNAYFYRLGLDFSVCKPITVKQNIIGAPKMQNISFSLLHFKRFCSWKSDK